MGMNRRQFVRDSVASGWAGLSGAKLAFGQSSAGETVKMSGTSAEPAGNVRVYAHLLDPREHPDYTRRHVRPPSWDTFGGHTHLATLRGFEIEHGQIVGYAAKIDKYVHRHQLGDVLWVSYPIIEAANLGDLAREIKRQNLFLFDLWGYVPGSGPGGYWRQFHPSAQVLELLAAELGEHWLGMDNGEQDGRYIGGYASELQPSSAGRLEQYLNFHRHFQKLTTELGNRMAALVSLNYGHYFLREGIYTLIGAETGQGLPNGQVYYAFIRGAGKQYGVLWFGSASVWNRWGWKEYGAKPSDDNFAGPTKGTSLSLLKRLMYSQVLYNSVLVALETSYFYNEKSPSGATLRETDELSPIGRLQQAVGEWIRETGSPGVMVAPIALMLDFFAGWTFPRHLYANNLYRVWGNLPYGPGDYLTDGVLDLLYPGYQNSSYFHDETGFLTATPYGDAADCVLSDTPGWLLARYATLVVAGELGGGAEVRDKLDTYAREGGHLLITAGSLANLPGGLAGLTVKGSAHFTPQQSVRIGRSTVVEDGAFDLHALSCPRSARVVASVSGMAAVLELEHGKGRVTVFASPFGIGATPAPGIGATLAAEGRDGIDKLLAKPYPLLRHVRTILDRAFRRPMLFEPGDGLSWITCRKAPGEYTLAVGNNSWQEKPMKLVSHCGPIQSVRELPLDETEKAAVGYLPEGMEKTDLGVSDEGNIAGGGLRIFAVRVREEEVEEITPIVPLARPRGRALPLRTAGSIEDEVLSRPTFFQHFDSVVVDWRYLWRREMKDLLRQSEWLRLQQLKVLVDLSAGINLYPDLRLVDNDAQEYSASMATIEEVIGKMELLPARDLILSLHRYPENN